MDTNTLTTAPEEEQVNMNTDEVEIKTDETQPEEPANSGNDDQAVYDAAWDRVDVDNPESLDQLDVETTTVDNLQVDLQNQEPATMDEIAGSINAFMMERPVLKFKGNDIPIDDPKELIALAQKGFLLETEMSKIKPQKKVLEIVDGIPADVLQAVSDLHKGNKNAINYLKKQYGIEDTSSSNDDFFGGASYDTNTNTDDNYSPAVPADNAVLDYWNSFIQANPAEAGKVNEVYEGLDESFKSEIYKPETFPLFVNSVVAGEFEKAYPIAVKEKAVNPALTWLQAYGVAVQKIGKQDEPQVSEPPAAAQVPNQAPSKRDLNEQNLADRVWEDDSYFKELEAQIFS